MKFINGLVHAFSQLLLAFALLGGIGFLIQAVTSPSGYNLYSASAPQVTQVYTEAVYYGVVSVAFFLFAILLHLATNATDGKVQSQIAESNEETVRVLKAIGRALQQTDNFTRR